MDGQTNRRSRQPPAFLFATTQRNSLLRGFFAVQSPAAAAQLHVILMQVPRLFVALLLAACVFQIHAADDSWPPLPKGSLTITNLGPRPGVKNVKTDSSEVRRDGERVASITRA